MYCLPLNDSSGGSAPTPFCAVVNLFLPCVSLRHTHGGFCVPCSIWLFDYYIFIHCILSTVFECCQEKYSFPFIPGKGRFFFTARHLHVYIILSMGIEKRTPFQSSYRSHGSGYCSKNCFSAERLFRQFSSCGR